MKNLYALLCLTLYLPLSWNYSLAQNPTVDSSLIITQVVPDFNLQSDSLLVSSLLFFQQLSPSVSPFLRNQAGNEGQQRGPLSFSAFIDSKYSSLSSALRLTELPAFRPIVSSKWPFSFIEYYQAGASDEAYQKLRVIHARQINPNLIAGFSGGTLSSKGSFVRQEAKLYDFSIWSRYTYHKYSLLVTGVVNSAKNQENGGLESDSLFINQKFDSPKYDLDVNLADAQLIQQNKSLAILNKFVLDKDSTSSNHSLNWLLFYGQADRDYSDGGSNDSFYQSLGFDSIISADSSFHSQTGSSIAYQFQADSTSFLQIMQLSTHYAYQQFLHQVDTFDFHNLDFSIGIGLKSFKVFSITGNATYALSGWNRKNYQFSVTAENLHPKLGNLRAGFHSERQNPDFLLVEQISKYYHLDSLPPWVNTFVYANWSDKNDMLQVQVQAGIAKDFWFLHKVDTLLIQKDPVPYAVATATYHLQRNWFNWDSKVLLQVKKLDNFSLPAWQLNTRFAFKGYLFERKAHFQMGTELFLNDESFLPFYNPVLGVFGQQSIYEQTYYPLVNLFLLFEIKTAQVYLNYENITGLIYAKNLMNAYQYPFPLPRFGFGINWYAFD